MRNLRTASSRRLDFNILLPHDGLHVKCYEGRIEPNTGCAFIHTLKLLVNTNVHLLRIVSQHTNHPIVMRFTHQHIKQHS